MLFCPGREPIGQIGNLSFEELIENSHYLEKERLFFSTKLEMSKIFPTPEPFPDSIRG
jgi:hypothetical protein